MLQPVRLGLLLLVLAACANDYSPDIYAPNAVQQVNKVEPGVVIGFRQVRINANGTIGAVTGGAAGGILGAQADSGGVIAALGGVGGTFIGGIVGTTVEHVSGDTTGWEYIVRKPNGDLISVAQREESPIPLDQKVLVIGGNQARIVADYSKPPDPAPPAPTTSTKRSGADPHATAADGHPAPPARPPAAGPAQPSAVPAPVTVEALPPPPTQEAGDTASSVAPR